MSAHPGFSLRFRLLVSAALAASMLLLLSTATFARVLGDTGVAYSADRALSVNGQRFDGAVYAMPGFQRHEQIMAGGPPGALFHVSAAPGPFVVSAPPTHIS